MLKRENSETRSRIMQTMLELAKTVPLGQMTVRDICQSCDISRKTFYNYFSNKYDLVQEIFRVNLAREPVPTGGRPDGEVKELYVAAYVRWASFLKENGALIRNIYGTDQWNMLEDILLRCTLDVVLRQVEGYLEGRRPITEQLHRMLEFYCCGEVGYLLAWIVSGQKESPEEVVQTIMDSVPFELLKWYRDTGVRLDEMRDDRLDERGYYRLREEEED